MFGHLRMMFQMDPTVAKLLIVNASIVILAMFTIWLRTSGRGKRIVNYTIDDHLAMAASVQGFGLIVIQSICKYRLFWRCSVCARYQLFVSRVCCRRGIPHCRYTRD